MLKSPGRYGGIDAEIFFNKKQFSQKSDFLIFLSALASPTFSLKKSFYSCFNLVFT